MLARVFCGGGSSTAIKKEEEANERMILLKENVLSFSVVKVKGRGLRFDNECTL